MNFTKRFKRLPWPAMPSLLLALAAGSAFAAGGDMEAVYRRLEEKASATTYIDALAMPAVAKVCDAGFPGYRRRFDAAYGKWQRNQEPFLKRGELAVREELARSEVDFDAYAALVVKRKIQALQSQDRGAQESLCGLWLLKVASV
jgi:hypothetical protein